MAALVGYPLVYGILLSLQDRVVGKPGHFIGLKNFFDQFQRPDLLAGRDQHLCLYDRGDPAEDGRRSRARRGDEPRLSDEECDPGLDAVAVHRADGAQHGCLDVDARPGVQRRQPRADRPRRHAPGALLARHPGSRDVFGDHDQHLARPAVLRHHPARRTADHAPRTVRGGDDRRRQRLAALPLCDAAVAEADHSDRDPVLGDLHLRRLPARLCADPWRAAECDQSVRDLCLRHRHGRRPARPRRVDRVDDAAGAWGC